MSLVVRGPVTPGSAGWTYVGFEVATASFEGATGERELCLVVLSGSCTIESEHGSWALDGRADPFTLTRVSIRGDASQLARDNPALKARWLERFPEQAINFELADFSFWQITPRDARFVAGFGRIHNLSAEQLMQAAT